MVNYISNWLRLRGVSYGSHCSASNWQFMLINVRIMLIQSACTEQKWRECRTKNAKSKPRSQEDPGNSDNRQGHGHRQQNSAFQWIDGIGREAIQIAMLSHRRIDQRCQTCGGKENQHPANESDGPRWQFVLIMGRLDGLSNRMFAGHNDQHLGIAAGQVRTHEAIVIFANDCVLEKRDDRLTAMGGGEVWNDCTYPVALDAGHRKQ